MKDVLIKATAQGLRVYAAVTTRLVDEAVKRHDCFPVAAAALGRTMTGALLLAANLKNDEAITIKFLGDGPLGRIVADAVPEGFTRGYVDNPHVDLPLNANGKIDVAGGVGQNGIVSVTRFTGLRQNFTGSAEIISGEIAEDLTHYLFVSEQTPSSIGLGVLVEPDLSIKAAGGFFVQPLPDADNTTLDRVEYNLSKISAVTDLIAIDKLDAKGIIGKILEGLEVHYLSATDLNFKCQCSRERTADVLASLNSDDLKSLIDDGRAEICCHFCNEKYLFTKDELISILEAKSKN